MADGSALQPAEALVQKNASTQPNESPEYRKAREALLREEIELRRHIERVAAAAPRPAARRRGEGRLPVHGRGQQRAGRQSGGAGRPVREKDTLFVYNWMYGPKRERPCPMCTALLSSMNGNADHIRQRVALAIVGLSPIERQIAFKVERGWKNLPMYADVNGQFSQDYHAIMDDGDRHRRPERLHPQATGSSATSGARRVGFDR